MLPILLISQICSVSAVTGGRDGKYDYWLDDYQFFFYRIFENPWVVLKNGAASGLQALQLGWNGSPKSWKGSDPCGTDWVGITCDNNNRVISM